MEETMILQILLPVVPGRFKKLESSLDVAFNEWRRIVDAAVDMGFRCKVNHRINGKLFEHLIELFLFSEIPLKKMIIRVGFNPSQVGEVPCIGQRVKIDDRVTRVLSQPIMNQVRTNETGTPGDQDDHPSK